MTPKKITMMAGVAVAAVGAIDLLEGNTGKNPLPDFIANLLTQQVDLLLIGIGVVMIFFL